MRQATNTSSRRNTSAETESQSRPEGLAREAGRLLAACGVERPRAWVSRTVREYTHRVSATGYPFGAYLLNRVELNAEQRTAALTNSELRYLLDHADPTGEEAVGFVRQGASFRRGASR